MLRGMIFERDNIMLWEVKWCRVIYCDPDIYVRLPGGGVYVGESL